MGRDAERVQATPSAISGRLSPKIAQLLRRDARTPSAGLLTCLSLRDKLSVIVKHMLEVSDNDSAETPLRTTALAAGRPATSEDGTAVVREVLTRYAIGPSGLTKAKDGRWKVFSFIENGSTAAPGAIKDAERPRQYMASDLVICDPRWCLGA